MSSNGAEPLSVAVPNYPRHSLVVFGGDLQTGTSIYGETWSCGIRSLGMDAGWSTDLDGWINGVYSNLQSWFTGVGNKMNSAARLTFLKINNIQPNGKYAESITHQHAYSPVAGGGGATAPNFLSVCFSWTTNVARGPASMGRIYPPFGFASNTTAVLTAGDVTNAINSAKALLSALFPVTPVSGEGAPAVVSAKGAANVIHGVRIGNVIDVQRRRKEQIPESYTAAAWP